MKKVSILIPHYRTAQWTAACVHHFKTYPIPIESEIIVCDNSPGHPSINILKETRLGEGIKIVDGNPNFPSHGQGYQRAYEAADGDWIFTSETDSFPIRHGWFDNYIAASSKYDFIGPEMPMGGGTYIHPAGAVVHRSAIERAEEWQRGKKDWFFAPGAAIKFGLSDKGYHVVFKKEDQNLQRIELKDDTLDEINLWANVGVWQEMRSFDEDSFDSYWKRTGIFNFEPIPDKNFYLKIGYEPGQWLSYFIQNNGIKFLKAPNEIQWMAGHEGKQAASTVIFGGFVHVWCGTVSNVSSASLDSSVVSKKLEQMNFFFSAVDEDVKQKLTQIQ